MWVNFSSVQRDPVSSSPKSRSETSSGSTPARASPDTMTHLHPVSHSPSNDASFLQQENEKHQDHLPPGLAGPSSRNGPSHHQQRTTTVVLSGPATKPRQKQSDMDALLHGDASSRGAPNRGNIRSQTFHGKRRSSPSWKNKGRGNGVSQAEDPWLGQVRLNLVQAVSPQAGPLNVNESNEHALPNNAPHHRSQNQPLSEAHPEVFPQTKSAGNPNATRNHARMQVAVSTAPAKGSGGGGVLRAALHQVNQLQQAQERSTRNVKPPRARDADESRLLPSSPWYSSVQPGDELRSQTHYLNRSEVGTVSGRERRMMAANAPKRAGALLYSAAAADQSQDGHSQQQQQQQQQPQPPSLTNPHMRGLPLSSLKHLARLVNENPGRGRLRRAFYRGLPADARVPVWCALGNVDRMRARNPNLFGRISTLPCKDSVYIQLDVPRTCPYREEGETIVSPCLLPAELEMVDFSAALQERLKKVLLAYAIYDPSIGYKQGMNFYVAPLIALIPSDEDVFWLLVVLFQDYGVDRLYRGDDFTLRCCKRFDLLIADELPALWKHFEKLGVQSIYYFNQWIRSLFLNASHRMDIAIRFLDVFLVFGLEAYFRVGIGILRLLQEDMLKHDEFSSVIMVLKKLCELPVDHIMVAAHAMENLVHLEEELNGFSSLDETQPHDKNNSPLKKSKLSSSQGASSIHHENTNDESACLLM